MIVKPSSLGDIAAALIVIEPLRRRFPDATIDWVVGEKYSDLLLDVPGIDRLLLFDRESWKRPASWPLALKKFLRLVREARRARYDVAIDLQGLTRSALITFLSGARTRLGFSTARELSSLFYNRRIAVPEGTVHAVDRYLLAAEELGAAAPCVSFPLVPKPEASARVRDLLDAGGAGEPLVVLNPTARWETKRWMPDRYAEAGDYVREVLGGSAVMIGGADERETVSSVARMMKGECIDLSGKLTLGELTALLAMASALVTNDTGPMHIAAAVGTPVVAIFGPTDPARTGPCGRHRAIRASAPCSPCLSRRCGKAELECMKSISTAQVTTALREVLKESEQKKNEK